MHMKHIRAREKNREKAKVVWRGALCLSCDSILLFSLVIDLLPFLTELTSSSSSSSGRRGGERGILRQGDRAGPARILREQGRGPSGVVGRECCARRRSRGSRLPSLAGERGQRLGRDDDGASSPRSDERGREEQRADQLGGAALVGAAHHDCFSVWRKRLVFERRG